MDNNIEQQFSPHGGLMELVAIGAQHFKNDINDPYYVSQLYGQNLTHYDQNFTGKLTRHADITTPISLQIYFKRKITDDDLRQYVGNHLKHLEISFNNNCVLYKIDKFLLINLTPKIIKLDDYCIDINIPWTELGFREIKLIAMQCMTTNVNVVTMISGFNEVVDIVFTSEYTYLDTKPRQEMAQSIHHEIIMRFEPYVSSNTRHIELDLTQYDDTIGLLITSNNILPKINKINFGVQQKFPEKISDNMYYVPFINDNKLIDGHGGQISAEITFDNECDNVLIYRVIYANGVIQHGIITVHSNASSFDETSLMSCVYPPPPETLSKNKFKQQLLQTNKDELLESIMKNLVIEI